MTYRIYRQSHRWRSGINHYLKPGSVHDRKRIGKTLCGIWMDSLVPWYDATQFFREGDKVCGRCARIAAAHKEVPA